MLLVLAMAHLQVKESVKTGKQNNDINKTTSRDKDAVGEEGGGRTPAGCVATDFSEPSKQIGQSEAGSGALTRNQPEKSRQMIQGDESSNQRLAETRQNGKRTNGFLQKSARENRMTQLEEPTRPVRSFDHNQPDLVNQDRSIRTIQESLESSRNERMISYKKDDQQETNTENLSYKSLAARVISVKESRIRTPIDVPQLTDLYLAQLQSQAEDQEGKEDKAESKAGRWQIGLAFAPTYFNPNMSLNEGAAGYQAAANASYYAFNASAADVSALQQANQELEQASPSGLSYQSGIRLEYALSKQDQFAERR